MFEILLNVPEAIIMTLGNWRILHVGSVSVGYWDLVCVELSGKLARKLCTSETYEMKLVYVYDLLSLQSLSSFTYMLYTFLLVEVRVDCIFIGPHFVQVPTGTNLTFSFCNIFAGCMDFSAQVLVGETVQLWLPFLK